MPRGAGKGAAIAADRLRDKGLRLTMLPPSRRPSLFAREPPPPSPRSFRDNRNELSFQLDLGACAALAPPAAADALTVASSTDYRVLGGAVANRLRANKVTSLRAIGKKAVWAAMRAVAVAREYTAADDRAATLARTPRPRFFSRAATRRS